MKDITIEVAVVLVLAGAALAFSVAGLAKDNDKPVGPAQQTYFNNSGSPYFRTP
jgi:hypothetical protein